MGSLMDIHGAVIAILVGLICIAPFLVRAVFDFAIWLMGYGDDE